MDTITDYLQNLDEPLASVAKSLQACIEKSLPAAHGGLVDGHPVWSNGDAQIAALVAYGDHISVTLIASGETRDYTSVATIDLEELNLWLSAEDIR